MATLSLAFLAGVLSILSPCVLPLLPLVLGAAVSENRYGLVALAAGLTFSFVAIGMFVAMIGFAIGLDSGMFRAVGGLMILGLGGILMAPALQTRLAVAGAPIADWGERTFGKRVKTQGNGGQFAVGLLLGMVWSPCVGPTLGAASVLAAQGRDLPQVTLTMTAFGVGAALPLLALGSLSRARITALRGSLHSVSGSLKFIFGGVLAGIGILILSGWDKVLESTILARSPDWLIDLTTRF